MESDVLQTSPGNPLGPDNTVDAVAADLEENDAEDPEDEELDLIGAGLENWTFEDLGLDSELVAILLKSVGEVQSLNR